MRRRRPILSTFLGSVARFVPHNLSSLDQLTKQTLDAAAGPNRKFYLTIACPAGMSTYCHYMSTTINKPGPANYTKLRLQEMTPYLDFYNLMAYDFAGSWSPVAGHQANIYPSSTDPASTPFSIVAALQHYAHVGLVPSEKIVLGMPMYGRAFTDTNGPGTAFNGVGQGSWENGVWDYKDLPRSGATEHLDRSIGASWGYDSATRTMVSYDTLEMEEIKAGFVRQQKLGGVMWWESSGDKGGKTAEKADGSLLGGFVGCVGGMQALDDSANALDYPESKYDNVREGVPGE